MNSFTEATTIIDYTLYALCLIWIANIAAALVYNYIKLVVYHVDILDDDRELIGWCTFLSAEAIIPIIIMILIAPELTRV
jgi:hypothetical protein